MFGLVPIPIRLWPMVWLLRWMVILATLLIGSMVHMVFNGCLPGKDSLESKSSIIHYKWNSGSVSLGSYSYEPALLNDLGRKEKQVSNLPYGTLHE